MLRVLWGRAGSGKTTYVVNEICARARNGERGLILLVPEPFSHDCERLLAKTGGPAVCLSAEVLTFGRMAERVLSPYGGAMRALDEGGRLLTMRLAVQSVRESLRLFAASAGRPVFLAALLKTADECKCYGLTPEILYTASQSASGASARKLHELSLIYAAYDAVLARGAMDPRDRLTMLAEKIRSDGYAADKSLYVDSFVTFTPQERRILSCFVDDARDVTLTLLGDPEEPAFAVTRRTEAALAGRAGEVRRELLPSARRFESPSLTALERDFFDPQAKPSPADGAIRALSAPSVQGECDFIAAEIRRLVSRGLRYRDIVVAVPDMPRYGPHLEQAFEVAQVPLFLDGMDEVSQKPLCRYLQAVSNIVTRGWRCEDVIALFGTGLFRAPRARLDRLEGYLKRWRPEGGKWAADWGMHPRGYTGEWTDEDIRDLRMYNRLRLLVYRPLSRIKGESTAAGWHGALLRYIRDSRLQNTLSRRMKGLRARGELKASVECAQLWEILLAAMDQCASILGDAPMGFDTYTELLLLTLSGSKVGSIPVSLDRVTVGELGRLRRFSAKAVFVPGCDEAHMPSARMPDSLLSVEERAVLESLEVELPPDGEMRLLRETLNVYSAFALPSQRLYLSFTREASGEELPSDALRRACESGGVRIEALEPAERAWRRPERLRAPLGRESVNALYGSAIRLSATRLEEALSCRFAFFCKYGLRVRPDIEPGYTPLDTGLFVHEVLEKTGRRVQSAGGAKAVPAEQVLLWAEEAGHAYVERVLRGLDEHGRRFRRRFEELVRSASLIAENVHDELARSEFVPHAFELKFGGADTPLPPVYRTGSDGGPAFEIVGKVDRVDIWRSADNCLYVRVVDYKTGARDFSLAELYYGKRIQLPLYLFCLTARASELFGADRALPAGMLYLPARRPLVTAAGRITDAAARSALDRELRREGLLLSDTAVLDAMGSSPASPSPFLPVEWKKDGPSSGALVTAGQLELLSAHVNGLVERAAASIAAGDVSATPLAESPRESACTWCDFARCCYFSEEADGIRRMDLKDADFWKALESPDEGGDRG